MKVTVKLKEDNFTIHFLNEQKMKFKKSIVIVKMKNTTFRNEIRSIIWHTIWDRRRYRIAPILYIPRVLKLNLYSNTN